MRLDNRVCSGWFTVAQGNHQECVLAPLLFDIFYAAAVINVASTHFKTDKGITDEFVHLRKKREAGGRGGGRKQLQGQSWLHRFGACFMLTIPGSSSHHLSS